MTAVLVAETDPHILDFLPRIVSDRIPNVEVDVCSSPDDLRRDRKLGTYDTVAISPVLLQGYRLLKYKADRHLVTPILVTATRQDHELASQFIKKSEAFDPIVKPLVPEQAVLSVRLALWQNKLLKLLAAREQASQRFDEHIKAFPGDLKMEQVYKKQILVLERTLQTIEKSLRLIINNEEERSFLEMAAFVDQCTRERALDRLLTLNQDGTSH